jgi:hypothetical protein
MIPKRMISFRAPRDDYDRWVANAVDAGLTFTEWAIRRLNGPVPAMPNLAKVIAAPVVKKVVGVPPELVKASTKCEHRIPPGTYCKSCERIKR